MSARVGTVVIGAGPDAKWDSSLPKTVFQG